MFHNKIIAISLLIASCTLICADQLDVDLSKASFPTETQYVVENDNKASASTAVPQQPVPKTTTTSKPTTTVPPDTTTTTAKTTTTAPTTSAPITTTPAPSPYPEPQIGTWNCSCIMIKMAAQLNFTYVTKANVTKHGLYNIPKDAKVDDEICKNNNTQSIQLNWGPMHTQQSFLMQFDNRNKSFYVSMIKIVLTLLPEDFPDAKENETIQFVHRSSDDLKTPLKMSYHCTRTQHFNFTETIDAKDIIGTMKVHDVQLEAFRVSNSTGFSNVHDCDSSETSDVVPIAVGIALVALILIVLISYLCARRQSRGYMSF